AGPPSGRIYTIFWAGDNTTGGGFGPENEMTVHLELAAANIWVGGEIDLYAGGTFVHSDPGKGTQGNPPVAPVLPDNTWHHVAATWSSEDNAAQLYYDGELLNQSTYSVGDFELSNIFLGQMANGTRQYAGLLDDVQLYDHALTYDDVQFALAGGKGAGPATKASPADGSVDVPREAVLGWSPGPYAATHDVYFGTVFDDVNAAGRTEPRGVLASQGQTGTTFAPAGLLAFDQTYYWRVDEVNAPPTEATVFKGKVWGFTTEPYAYPVTPVKATASSFYQPQFQPVKTIDGSGLGENDEHSASSQYMWLSGKTPQPPWIQYEFDQVYKLHQMWVWNQNQAKEVASLRYGARDVTITTSVDGTAWTTLANVPEFAQGTGEPNYVHNTTVDFGGVLARYVKLTVNSNWGSATKQAGLSEVRFFQAPLQPRGPEPASGAADVPLSGTLRWRPGREAVRHDVCIGTDPDAVLQGTAPITSVTASQVALAALGAEYDRTYYWKVSEVNEAATLSPWVGQVWSFSTPECLVVDDMESYNDQCNRVYYAWKGGAGNGENAECGQGAYGGNGTGSIVGNFDEPYAERTIVHRGRQSMPFVYDNTAGAANSEATRTFPVAQDWTAGGVRTLVLFLRGEADNGAGELYVKVNDVKVVYNGSPEVLTRPLWKQWNVDLTSVAGLQAVRSLTIGVSGAVRGKLYIDDLRLYREAPAVPIPEDPGTNGLAAHYTFEGDAKDVSGNKRDGVPVNDPRFVELRPGLGRSIVLDGVNDHVELPIGALMSTLTSATIATWVDFDLGSTGSWQRLFDFGTDPNIYMFLTPRVGTSGTVRFAATTGGNAAGAESVVNTPGPLPGGWHHLAVVIDGGTQTVVIYLDGDPVASGPTQTLPRDLGVTTQNWLGRSQYDTDGYFGGALDEFRIYDRALSMGEVAYLAGDR
ncbi:MAG: discoidin domain-containing protein, partial [Phycisphaerae bacterium]|nr:discoidin domain-containing protein [Phycisphaerae bacterium]